MAKVNKILSPEEINSQRLQDTNQRLLQGEITVSQGIDENVIKNNLPSSLKLMGQDKLANLIAKKGEEVKQTLIVSAIGLASELGIKQVGTSNQQFPNFCLEPKKLEIIIKKRNQIVEQLNKIVKSIDNLSKALIGINTFVDITKVTLNIIKTSRLAASTAVKIIPSPPGTPGAITSLLSDLKDVQDKLSPKLEKNINILDSITLSVAVTNATLLQIITILNSLDKVISGCNKDANIIPLSDNLKELESINQNIPKNNPIETTYKQFILDVIEEQFSPTITRKVGVAKNSQGIILLKTPPSFTTTPQILIDELKLIIDSKNLQAN